LLGEPGSRHLGASGVTHGLMFLVFVLGLLRRDRPAIATSMIAFLFYGGMLMTILPHEAGVSWQSHLGGAVAGLIAALLLRLRDPQQAKPRYSWEDTDEDAAWDVNNPEHAMLEPPPPRQVPVLWQHQDDGSQSVVLHFPPRERPPGA
ncbi:rhomboid family intramembrane serine protease, partial [Xanthomonas oryzae pv. oryzae]